MTPPLWVCGFPLWEIWTCGYSPMVREACDCVCVMGNVHRFPGRFPLWTKAEIQGTRKLNPWPTEGKTETEICVCEQVTLHKWKEMSGQGGQSQRFESWPQSSPDAWFQANSFSSSIRWEWNSSIYLTRLLCELVNIGQVPRTLLSTQ